MSWILGALAMAAEPSPPSNVEVAVLTADRGWTTVHDTVMGGVSNGRVTPRAEPPGSVQFEGEVSLDNNGGFASVRTLPASLGLDGIDALRIEVVGDGHRWNFTVRRDDLPIRGGSWRVTFETTGERQVIEVPLERFEAVAFGRRLPGAPSLVGAGAHIDSVGFLIGDKQAGPYHLDILSITGVRRTRD